MSRIDDVTIEGIKTYPNNLYICSDRIIIKDKTLDIDIDMTDYIKVLDKIIIDGIVFVKEKQDE